MNLLLSLLLGLLALLPLQADAARVWADRVKQTSTITGTGSYSLDAAVPTSFRSFVAGVGDGNTAAYLATDGTDWEICDGTVTDATPDTLSRGACSASTNGGSLVSWSAADVTIVTVLPAAWIDDAAYQSQSASVSGAWSFDSLDINGGTVDNATIGGSIAGSGSFTALTSNGIDDNADATAITIDSDESVIIGETSTLGLFSIHESGNTDTSIMWSGAIAMADEASASLETLVDGGTKGFVAIVWYPGSYCEFYINASTASYELSDAFSLCRVDATDGYYDLYPDGDGTYTLKNRRGSSNTLHIFFWGME